MRISDEIAAYILQQLNSEDGTAELQRNLLAEEIGCVPSQINYVLSSRFTPEQGYLVESRRGGGGYIRVHRVKLQPTASPLMHVVNAIGDALVPATAQAIIENLVYHDRLSPRAAQVMAAAVSDQAYRQVPPELRDRVRATVLKQMLTAYNME